MKMLKGDNNKYNVLEKLANDKSWDRYDRPVDVPNEQYDGILKSADAQVQKHRDNAQRAREKGNTEAAQKELEKAKRYEDAKKGSEKRMFQLKMQLSPEKIQSYLLQKKS